MQKQISSGPACKLSQVLQRFLTLSWFLKRLATGLEQGQTLI
jgi:hypothetical protein